jgi:hypothetical protein
VILQRFTKRLRLAERNEFWLQRYRVPVQSNARSQKAQPKIKKPNEKWLFATDEQTKADSMRWHNP